jgi:hypothetical protein
MWSEYLRGPSLGLEEKGREVKLRLRKAARRPLAPGRRILVSLGARLCIRIPTYVVLVVHCMGHASVPASWLGQHSRKQAVFWDAGGSTRGSTLVRVRVRTYAARELRFSGMIPSQRLKGRLLRIVLTLVRTDDDCVR